MKKTNPSELARKRRKKRFQKMIRGTPERPRLCVFRSNKIFHVQLVDDSKSVTLFEVDTRQVKKGFSIDGAKEVGKILADLGRIDAAEYSKLLRRDVRDALVELVRQQLEVHRQPRHRCLGDPTSSPLTCHGLQPMALVHGFTKLCARFSLAVTNVSAL